MIIKKLQQLKAKKGFTLVELLVVIAIIGILAAVLIPLMSAFLNNARISNAESTANQTATAIQTPLNAIMGRGTENGKPRFATTGTDINFLGVFTARFSSTAVSGFPNGTWIVERLESGGPPAQVGVWNDTAATAGTELIRDALNDSYPGENIGVFLIRIGRRPNTWESDTYVTVAFVPGGEIGNISGGTAWFRALGPTEFVSGTARSRNDPHFSGNTTTGVSNRYIVNGRVQGVQGRPIVGTFPPQ